MIAALLPVTALLATTTGAQADTTTPGTLDSAVAGRSSLAAANSGLQVVVNERGHISRTITGASTDAADVPAELVFRKPDGATVRKAYLAYATTGGTVYPLTVPLQLEGQPVPLSHEVPTGIHSYNYFADVTSILKGQLNATTDTLVDVKLTEPDPTLVDGEVLVVIWDDPTVTADQSVTMLYGALAPAGDTYGVNLTEPVNLADPNLHMDMSLGISYSYQEFGGSQYSTIDVNGSRLTS